MLPRILEFNVSSIEYHKFTDETVYIYGRMRNVQWFNYGIVQLPQLKCDAFRKNWICRQVEYHAIEHTRTRAN